MPGDPVRSSLSQEARRLRGAQGGDYAVPLDDRVIFALGEEALASRREE
jgi:hypothetical protein